MTRLEPCPDRPSCVSSQAHEGKFHIEPFELPPDQTEATWQSLTQWISELPRVEVVQVDSHLAHFVFRTALLRFADDVHLERSEDPGRRIDVRSCSRVGYWDMGTNRRRVEDLRKRLIQAGLLVS